MLRRLFGVLSILIFLLPIALWTGCGSKNVELQKMDNGMSVPEWYLNMPSKTDYLYASATAKARDMQFAVDKARNNGRVEISRQFQTKISDLFKQFREETGAPEDSEFVEQATSVSKSVVSEVINGCKVSKQEVRQGGKLYQAFVLMEMPIGKANATLMSKIRANEHLYTRFRASKGFKELEKEVEQYEQWKKEQGM